MPEPEVTPTTPADVPGGRPNEPLAPKGPDVPMQPGGPPYIPANPSLYPPGDPPKFSPAEEKKHRESAEWGADKR